MSSKALNHLAARINQENKYHAQSYFTAVLTLFESCPLYSTLTKTGDSPRDISVELSPLSSSRPQQIWSARGLSHSCSGTLQVNSIRNCYHASANKLTIVFTQTLTHYEVSQNLFLLHILLTCTPVH